MRSRIGGGKVLVVVVMGILVVLASVVCGRLNDVHNGRNGKVKVGRKIGALVTILVWEIINGRRVVNKAVGRIALEVSVELGGGCGCGGGFYREREKVGLV